MTHLSRRAAAAFVAGALILPACASADAADDSSLRDAIQALDSAQGDLRDRIGELEGAMSALGAASGDDNVASGLLERLDALQEALDTLGTDLSQETLDRTDALAELAGALADLEALVSNINTSLVQQANDITSLREDHELLRQRFESHLRDHG